MNDDAFWTLVETLAAAVWLRTLVEPGHRPVVVVVAALMLTVSLWFAGVYAWRLWRSFWGRR